MALMDSVDVFLNLRWFMYFWSTSFRTSLKWCFRIFTVSQSKTKQLKWNTMNKNDEHSQIAKKLILCIPTSPLMSKCFSRSLTCDTNSTGVLSWTFRLTLPLDTQKECISFSECNVFYKETTYIYNKSIGFDLWKPKISEVNLLL